MSSFDLTTALSVISRLPKIEIHAHLHGSIRKSTLVELGTAAHAHVGTDDSEKALETLLSSPVNLKNCFQIFDVIHQTVQTKAAVERIMTEALIDFMVDNVVYLELRTTPRALADGTSMEEYVLLLCSLVDSHNSQYGNRMQARLLVSLDRSKPAEDAQAVIDVAIKCAEFSNAIVGIDFSGNPLRGSFIDFLPAIRNARANNLGITLHAAEVAEPETAPTTPEELNHAKKLGPFGEMDAILQFRPERLGHAVKLTPAQVDELFRQHAAGVAPLIELCPTSNLVTLSLTDIKQHPTLTKWLEIDYPLIICTDDMGVFSSNLTQEWALVHRELGISLPNIAQMTLRTVDYIFDKSARAKVRQMVMNRIEENALWDAVDLPRPVSLSGSSMSSEMDSWTK